MFTNLILDTAEANFHKIYFDCANTRTNVLSKELLTELKTVLQAYAQDPKPPSLIAFLSNKANGFLAGADIKVFDQYNPEQIAEYITLGQEVIQLIIELNTKVKISTLAVIHGFALGGGLELALACQYRLAVVNDQVQISKQAKQQTQAKFALGLPEVKLGIQPGWGGIIHLPKIIGHYQALNMMISGRILNENQALQLGLVDNIVAPRNLANALNFYSCQKNKPSQAQNYWQKLTTNLMQLKPSKFLLKTLFKYQLKTKVSKKHYPAPYKILESWYKIANIHDSHKPLKYQIEKQGLLKLHQTETAKNLTRLFLLKEQLKAQTQKIPDHIKSSNKPHVYIIGAGVMGTEIATWCLHTGHKVSLFDTDLARIGLARQKIQQWLSQKYKQTPKINQALDRLVCDAEGITLKQADIIIEAIIEDVNAKTEVLTQVVKQAKPEAIIATNTSTIELHKLNKNLPDPDRLIGVHFFNPVTKLDLVEIIVTNTTADTIKQQALQFINSINKIGVLVKSSPGFLVNRILMPYILEGVLMFDEGMQPESIDQAAINFGMPMGPLQLADLVGLDICQAAAINCGYQIPTSLEELIKNKKLGRKSKQGFYNYQQNKQLHKKILEAINNTVKLAKYWLHNQQQNQYKTIAEIEKFNDPELRLLFALLRETSQVITDQIVEQQDEIDAAMILGAGFAPFSGGPAHIYQVLGTEKIQTLMKYLSDRYGKRFSIEFF